MPAPESWSVFHAAQDPVLLRGLSLVSGFAANPSAAEPAPARHGALVCAVRGGCVPGGDRGALSGRAALQRPGGLLLACSRHHGVPEAPSPALCCVRGQAAWGSDTGALCGAAQPCLLLSEKPAATHGGEKAGTIPEVPERMCCSTCGQEFGSREEQTEHYRLDWHRFNLKQRLQGHRALPVEEFEEKSRAGEEQGCLGRAQRLLGGSEQPAELIASLQSLSASTCWVVLMMGGGHFAGAVFRGPQVQEHKTFHRYTVRARRGTAQSLRDAQTPGSAPRSAGASLRRYNEAALLKDIQGLLAAWAQHLKEAQRIFLRAPRHNRALLFDGRSPHLSRSDPRVCHIPLSTRRATLREVLRVHAVLSSLQVFGKDTPLEDVTGSPWRGWQKKQHAAEVDTLQTDTAPEEEEEEEEESPAGELETVEVTLGTLDLREFEVVPKRNRKRQKKRNKKMENGDPQTQLRDALFTACKTGDVGILRHLLGVPESRGPLGDSKDGDAEQPLDLPHSLLNQPVDEHGFTLLHVAARAGKAEAVCLLLEAGADPALRDKQERTPYCISADKPTRNAFRKFMVDHPDKYDYSRAKVPGPLTVEMEARKLEKKRAQKAQRKQREQAQREEQQRMEQEKEEKQRFAALSDREKRALAAERRLAEQMKNGSTALSNISRCWYCGESLLGRIPFHYLDFSFCSTACLQTHRRAQASHT
ncbi:UNVERIFIED_CONTAM: hypothetical protein H355_007744 [Colinus virginianus]|nr:hypothetical protein H355_007744 [Colinus virginianus]